MKEIGIGAIITVDDNGKNKEYQILDNSEVNKGYPIAILDIAEHKIVQTSVNTNYINYAHYIYIDKEYKIIAVK